MLKSSHSGRRLLASAAAVACAVGGSVGVARAAGSEEDSFFDQPVTLAAHTKESSEPLIGVAGDSHAASRSRPLPRTTAECMGLPATIVGTPGPDTLTGTPGDDVIASLGGADVVNGGGGADTICGGLGNDRLNGEAGDETLVGNGGGDTLRGGDGATSAIGDNVLGGPGGNIGKPGRDRIFPGSAGASIIIGDSYVAGTGSSVIAAAKDTITVSAGTAQFLAGDSFCESCALVKGGAADRIRVASGALAMYVAGDSFALNASTPEDARAEGGGSDRITVLGGALFVGGDSMSAGLAKGSGKDKIRANAETVVGDAYGEAGAGIGGGSDKIVALNRNGQDPDVAGDSVGEMLASGGGHDSIVAAGDGSVIGDSKSLGFSNALGGGNDRIRVNGAATVLGDSYATQGAARGGGDDNIAVTAPLASNPEVVGDCVANSGGNAYCGGDDRISVVGSSSSTITGDAYVQSSGNAIGAGDDSITSRTSGNIVADSFADGGEARRGGDDRVMLTGTGVSGNLWADGVGTSAAGGGDDTVIAKRETSFSAYMDPVADSGNAVGSGRDKVSFGAGEQYVVGDSSSSGGVSSGSAADVIRVGAGADDVYGDHLDPLATDSGPDRIYGGAGPDILLGGGERDEIYGGAGLDSLFGGPQFDLCDGGLGSPDSALQCEKKLSIP